LRVLSWLIGLPLALLVVVFALSNRQDAIIGMWPFAEGLPLPTYLLVLLPLVAGLLLGLLLGGLRNIRHRASARFQGRRAAALERELAASRDTTPPPPPSPAGDISVSP